MVSALYQRATITGVKAANAEWLAEDYAPDVQVGKAVDLICQFSLSADVVVEVTLNSGTDWTKLNSGVALGVDQLKQFDVFATNGDLVNFRTATVGGTTVDIGYVVADMDA